MLVTYQWRHQCSSTSQELNQQQLMAVAPPAGPIKYVHQALGPSCAFLLMIKSPLWIKIASFRT